MATVSASQPISTITPPHSSDGRTSWDYAVPLDHENVTLTDARLANSTSTSQHLNYDGRQPLAHERNGAVKRANTMESNKTSQSVDLRHPGKLTRKTSNLNNAAENGYGDPYRAVSGGMAPDNKRKLRSTDPEYDDSKWIHRDKLAQIESKELEEAGFRVPRKTMSRATSSRSSSQHRPEKLIESPQFEGPFGEEGYSGAFALPADKRQRNFTPGRVDEEHLSNVMDFEIRTPEEVASEREYMGRYATRPVTSRIPVKKLSPLPVQPPAAERSRGDSVGWTGSSEALDANPSNEMAVDDEPSTPPSFSTGQGPVQHSPPKARVPTKANPTSAPRKVSNSAAPRKTSATAQSRNVSANSPTKRPGTSSGRPSTSHPAPEGDPPWIASMYKPDPRLPPDQQILPTHAKRMAQEQWEKEGKTGTVYDRDFRLLNDETPVRPERLSALIKSAPDTDNTSEGSPKKDPLQIWPLAPTLQQRSSAATSTGRPGTSGTDHGGYSIMPTLNSPKLPPGSPTPALPSPRPVEVMRVQDPESGPQYQELEKKKAGCGCCVVM